MITCGKDPPKKEDPIFFRGKNFGQFSLGRVETDLCKEMQFSRSIFREQLLQNSHTFATVRTFKKQTFLQHFGNAFFSKFAADVPASRRVYDLSTTSHSQGPAEVRESMPRTYAFPVSFAVNCRVNFNTWRFAAREGTCPSLRSAIVYVFSFARIGRTILP